MQGVVIESNATAKPPDISERTIDLAAYATLDAVKRYFQRPGVRQEYEAWLKEYRERQAEKGTEKRP